jgi:serine/threonine protein kinase
MFKKTAKFKKKSDVYSAGIVFLELLALKPPSLDMYDHMWPKIISVGLPHALNEVLSGCLDEDPSHRLLFSALLDLLKSNGGLQIRDLTYEMLSDEFVELIAYLKDDDADFSKSSSSGRVLQDFSKSSSSGRVLQSSISSSTSRR